MIQRKKLQVLRRRGITVLELLVIVAVLAILAAILFPVVHRPGENAPRSACQSNLKQIGLGIMQYTQDWNERMPLVAVHDVSSSKLSNGQPYGWADALHLYVKSTEILQCPSQDKRRPAPRDAVQSGFCDYWFNGNLSGRESADVAAPAQTLMCGDGNDGHDGADARYNRNVLPLHWLNMKNSPALRHIEGANYLFVDGHVKWLAPNKIGVASSRWHQSTFALQ
jgi:prepilin-type processing-associated H-X9-DG protein